MDSRARNAFVALYQILILAIVQGITEFLPISSSGHLVLTSRLLGWPDQGLILDIAVHAGTLLAVIVYFWRDIWQMVVGAAQAFTGRPGPGFPAAPVGAGGAGMAVRHRVHFT